MMTGKNFGIVALSALLLATGAARAADPFVAPDVAPAADYDSAYDWTGFYAGVHGGYADAEWDGTLTYDPGTGPMPGIWSNPHQSISGDGWLGGLQVGFNKQFGNFVLGLEADYSFADVEGEDTFRTATGEVDWAIRTKIDEFGTARLRAGYAFDRFLVYGTGGVAFGKAGADLTVVHLPDFVTARGSADEDHVGWAAGAGVEWGFAANWSLGAEWLYVDLGDADYRLVGTNFVTDPDSPHTTDSFPADLTMHVFRAKLNYRF